MRLILGLAGALLLTTAALAQPSEDDGQGGSQGPGYGQQQDAPPPQPYQQPGQQYAPPQGAPTQRPHVNMQQRFDAANVTHDGRLTRDQAQQARLGMVARNFDQIDADHKGYVTVQDIKLWHRAMRQARGQGGEQAPRPQQ